MGLPNAHIRSQIYDEVNNPPFVSMNRIIQIISRTDQPRSAYLWNAWLITFLPSFLLAGILSLIIPGGNPEFRGSALGIAFGTLILSPWIETLLMVPVLAMLRHFWKEPLQIAIGSAIVWSILHSLAAPKWGFTVFWPFLMFSLCFLAHERKSKSLFEKTNHIGNQPTGIP